MDWIIGGAMIIFIGFIWACCSAGGRADNESEEYYNSLFKDKDEE